jgi:hypothetical protein
VRYKAKNVLVPLSVLLVLLSAAGCGKSESRPKENKVLAKIQNYELTTEDFRAETRLTAPNKELSRDLQKAKEELLDEMIMKKIILQEAVRHNFDKDKAFMKEIERYWEQALFKLLTKEKMDELSREIVVKDSEVREAYERMSNAALGNIEPFEVKAPEIRDDIYNAKMQESLDKWFRELRAKADVKIYKENL